MDHAITPECLDKHVRGTDLEYILSDMYNKLCTYMATKQPIEDKWHRIDTNDRLMYIADRFVDIDFEELAQIPGLKNHDLLLVIKDETRDDMSSLYSIYNVGSVPNVRYLCTTNAEAYPTVNAVQQFVDVKTAKYDEEVIQLKNTIHEMRETIDRYELTLHSITAALESHEAKLKDLDAVIPTHDLDIQRINAAVEQLNASIVDNIASIDGVSSSVDTLTVRVSDNTDQIDVLGTQLSNNTQDLRDSITDVNASLTAEVSRATSAEQDLDGKITAEVTRATGVEDAISARVSTLEGKTANMTVVQL